MMMIKDHPHLYVENKTKFLMRRKNKTKKVIIFVVLVDYFEILFSFEDK